MKLKNLTKETRISLFSINIIILYIFSFTALLSSCIFWISKLNYDSAINVLKSYPIIFVFLTLFLLANMCVLVISIYGLKYAKVNKSKELKKLYLLSSIVILGFGAIIALIITTLKIQK